MQTAPKIQLNLPFFPATQVFMFIAAFSLAIVLAFAQQSQLTKVRPATSSLIAKAKTTTCVSHATCLVCQEECICGPGSAHSCQPR